VNPPLERFFFFFLFPGDIPLFVDARRTDARISRKVLLMLKRTRAPLLAVEKGGGLEGWGEKRDVTDIAIRGSFFA
jgi:hypothetical protein